MNLYIKELKEKFKNSSKISVQDFSDFYHEIIIGFNENLIHNYIYELKQRKIIRHISRGYYILSDFDRKNDKYIVYTMDIIKSTTIDYKEFNKILKSKIRDLNTILKEVYSLNYQYHISRGDEIQILLPFDRNMGEILLLTLSYLHPYKVRYAMSIGNITEEIHDNTWEMNEPIFWSAADILLNIKDKKSYAGNINYINNDIINNLMPIINASINKITDKQWEAIKLELSNKQNTINITKSSYYNRIRTSNLEEILFAFHAIYDIMKGSDHV